MKFFKIELIILLSLAILVLLVQFRIGLGYFHFQDIKVTLSDKQWKGAPYVVREITFQDQAYEEADLYRSFYSMDTSQLSSNYPFFLMRINDYNDSYFHKGELLELCLSLRDENIKVSDQSFFGGNYEVTYNFDVQYSPMAPIWVSSTDDYMIEYSSKLTWKGIGTKQYQIEKIKEFVLLKTLDNITEYTNLDEIYAKRQTAVAKVE